MADWDRDFVLGKLTMFHNQGQNELDSWKDDREDATAIWNAEFRQDAPENALYYPIIFYMLRHHVRAAVKTYMTPKDIVRVLPSGQFADDYEQRLARLKGEELNYHMERWNDMTEFIDDTFTQGEKFGAVCAKINWKNKYDETEFEVSNFEISEDGEPVEQKRVVTQERLVASYPVIEYVPIDDLLWDPIAKVWRDVRWVMQQNIEETEDELLALIDSDGFDDEEVTNFILHSQKQETQDKPEETTTFKRIEFWGYMLPNDTETDPVFIRCSCDQDRAYLLKYPTEDDIHRWPDTNEPLNPFQVGYLIRKEGEIVGESNCLRGKLLQAEIICIRDQRRRSIENELNEKWIWDKNAEVEIEEMDQTGHGVILKALGTDGVRELTHRSNTADSYREVDVVMNDLYWLYGTNPTLIGMPDAHLPDTAYGLNLMSNAANTVVYDTILHYNNTFMEPIFQKVLAMSLSYTPTQFLEGEGLDISVVDRENMRKTGVRISVDCGYGATSEEMRFQNKMQAYFITQTALDAAARYGVETGEMRFMIFDHLREILPLLNCKNLARYIPTPEELRDMTVKAMQQKMKMMQEQLAQQVQMREAEAELSGAQRVGDALTQALGPATQGAAQ